MHLNSLSLSICRHAHTNIYTCVLSYTSLTRCRNLLIRHSRRTLGGCFKFFVLIVLIFLLQFRSLSLILVPLFFIFLLTFNLTSSAIYCSSLAFTTTTTNYALLLLNSFSLNSLNFSHSPLLHLYRCPTLSFSLSIVQPLYLSSSLPRSLSRYLSAWH